MKKTTLFVLAFALATLTGTGKTVALWTMDPTVMPDGRTLLRCAVSPHNDLLLGTHNTISSSDQTIGWNLPPNPDTSDFLIGSATSRKCVTSSGIHNQTFFTSSVDPLLAKAVSPSHDFTLEGWMNISQFVADPSGSGRVIFFAGKNGRGSYSLQFSSNTTDTVIAKRDVKLVFRNDVVPAMTFCSLADTDMQDQWHHYAFAFTYDKGNGKSGWTFYVDGVAKGTVEHDQISNVAVDSRVLLGGATTGNALGNNVVGSFDYWRVSDRALAASDLLCAGGAGTSVPSHQTLAYWKLGRNPDGTVDARDYIGTADLSQGFYTQNTNYVENSAYGICAIRPWPESHDRHGAVKSLPVTGAHFQHPSLGAQLTFDRTFSVEGYIKPLWRGTEPVNAYLFGTLDNYSDHCRGWLFIMQRGESGYRFLVGAQDGVGSNETAERGNLTKGSGFQNSAVISSYYPFDEQWRKIRLTYTATSAGANLWNGTWTLYVDDELAGTATHGKTFDASAAPSLMTFDCFFIGGASKGGQAHALFDDWRVAVGNDEIAHWPLDLAANGVDMDVTDTHGTYSFAPVRNICVSANAGGPTVTNPDMSESFDGNPATSSGSVRIASTQNAKGYLAVYDPNLNVAMRDATEMTFEGWVNWDGTYTDNGWGIIFAVLPKAAPTSSNIDFMLRINYKGGITIYDKLFADLNGSSTLATLSSNTWTHLALVRTRYDSSGTIKSRYELFVNGESAGSVEANAKTSPAIPSQVFVGGEPWHDLNANSSKIRVFPGSVASFRLSKGALTPAEFLCAAGGEVASPATVAYWPLDNDSGVVDGYVAVGKGGYEMFMGGTGAVGQAGMARKKLDVVGVPSANDGSVSVASDPLFADHVGAFLAPVPHASWSVEGYFKNDAGGMVCRMGEVGCGWQLDYEPSQTRFSLVAAPGPQCAKCTSGTFLATAVMPGDWNHLLLTFDTSADLPVWRLYVNGKTAGSVTNIWSGVGTNYRGMFALGSGEFDLWRVSNGIVDVLDSLYQSPPGMSVIFR